MEPILKTCSFLPFSAIPWDATIIDHGSFCATEIWLTDLPTSRPLAPLRSLLIRPYRSSLLSLVSPFATQLIGAPQILLIIVQYSFNDHCTWGLQGLPTCQDFGWSIVLLLGHTNIPYYHWNINPIISLLQASKTTHT